MTTVRRGLRPAVAVGAEEAADVRSWLPSMAGVVKGAVSSAYGAPALVGVNVVRPVGHRVDPTDIEPRRAGSHPY